MEWYSDNISAGIAESKTKQLIFLVHIFDSENEIENQLWSDECVIKTCKENCISLKLESESQTCSFFKQIYPVTEYPTTYMIGLDGKPLEVVSGQLSPEEFISKFQKAIETHNLVKKTVSSQVPSTSESEPKSSDVPSESTSEAKQKRNIDDRVAQAKEKLKEIQEKKRVEEEEKERNNEMERRKLGQEILRAKREKEEQELRKIAEEKRKEKMEDELAKKRILEKIRQDREEKKRKYQQEKDTTEQTQEAQRLLLEQKKALEKQAEAARNSRIARIQFRFVDGSCISQQFDPDQILSDARDFVIQKLVEAKESVSFSMHTAFPKRKFTSDDMSRTFRDLTLTPSATILIIPGDNNSSRLGNFSSSSTASPLTTVATYASDIFSLAFSIFATMWGVVTSLFGFGPRGPTTINQNEANSNQRQNRSNAQSESIQNLRPRNMNNSNNVRNLNDLRDGDDENATWNGNSTQQM